MSPSTAKYRRVALAMILTFAGLAVPGTHAIASPEFSTNPTVTLEVTPNDGNDLPTPAAVTVTGAGFQSGGFGVSGNLYECAGTALCSNPLTVFTSNGAGSFTATVTVTRTFAAADMAGTVVDCGATPCRIEAESNSGMFLSQHHIAFAGTGGGPPPPGPVISPPVVPASPAAAPTGQRAAALKKCKKKKGKARKRCRKKAKQLPI